MDVSKKYGRSYFMPPEVTYDWVKKDYIETYEMETRH